MTKGQRRLAAIVLALLGIYGTLAALEDRVAMKEQAALHSEVSIEATVSNKQCKRCRREEIPALVLTETLDCGKL